MPTAQKKKFSSQISSRCYENSISNSIRSILRILYMNYCYIFSKLFIRNFNKKLARCCFNNLNMTFEGNSSKNVTKTHEVNSQEIIRQSFMLILNKKPFINCIKNILSNCLNASGIQKILHPKNFSINSTFLFLYTLQKY